MLVLSRKAFNIMNMDSMHECGIAHRRIMAMAAV